MLVIASFNSQVLTCASFDQQLASAWVLISSQVRLNLQTLAIRLEKKIQAETIFSSPISVQRTVVSSPIYSP